MNKREMTYSGRQIRILAMVIPAAAIAIAVACSSSPENPATSPTEQPTAAPVTTEPSATPITSDGLLGTQTPAPTHPPAVEPNPTRTPTPTPFPAMRVVELGESDLVVPTNASSYERLLARLPDNEITRSFLMLMDYKRVRDALDFPWPEPGIGPDGLNEYFDVLNTVASDRGFAPPFPTWPLSQRDYLSVIDWHPYLGFDMWSVHQSVHASAIFSTGSSGRPPVTYDIAFGDFDPDATANALANCDCDQPDIRQHLGVDYYSWGDEFIGRIEKRLSPPMYDHVGRGPRLLIRDGEAFYAIGNAPMETYIDVLQGGTQSLADDELFVQTVEAMASLGLLRDMSLYGATPTVDSVAAFSQNEPLFREVATSVERLHEFELVATAPGFDGERSFTALVITHTNAEAARANKDILLERIREVPLSIQSDETMADRLEVIEIGAVGNVLVARLYYHHPGAAAIGLPIPVHNTIILTD